jgi:phosphatidylserine synthase
MRFMLIAASSAALFLGHLMILHGRPEENWQKSQYFEGVPAPWGIV